MLPLFKPSLYDVFAKNHPTLGESHDSFTLVMIVPVQFLDVICLVHDERKTRQTLSPLYKIFIFLSFSSSMTDNGTRKQTKKRKSFDTS